MRSQNFALRFLVTVIIGFLVWYFFRPKAHIPGNTAVAPVAAQVDAHALGKIDALKPLAPPIAPIAPKPGTLPIANTKPDAAPPADSNADNLLGDIATAIPVFLSWITSEDINEQLKLFTPPWPDPDHYADSLKTLSGPDAPKIIETLKLELDLIKDRTPVYDDLNNTAVWDFTSGGKDYHIVWFKYQDKWWFGTM